MKVKNYICLMLLFATAFQLSAQRYLSPQFGVQRTADVMYGANIGILTGAPKLDTLLMDVYTPVGDTATNRPVIFVAHTGSFLPPLFNGQATGQRYDSTVIYTCGVLASMGYVTCAYTYRQGWLPTSDDENIRRSSLLQAAFRGIQDTRTAVRFMRRMAAESGNPYNIDPDKIGIVGIGTGGYMALGAGSLYDWGEITLDKFINTNTALPYIDSTLLGNAFATTNAQLCVANHAGYSSDIDFSFNIGGALGDASWIDGEEQEPAFAGVHCINDVFAPYKAGPVIVPTTNEFVVSVCGTRCAIEQANTTGANDIFDLLDASNDALRPLIEAQKQQDVTLLTGEMTKKGTDNFYGFCRPFPEGSPWDWWGKEDLDNFVNLVNFALGTSFNSDSIHLSGLATNPDMSAAKAKAHFDTIFALMLPRACTALELGCFSTGLTEISKETVGLEVGPNPASDQVIFKSSDNYPIQSIYVYDINGKLVSADVKRNTTSLTLKRGTLTDGLYVVQVRFKEGFVTQKVSFH